jgi:hypothetical protein
MASFTETVEKHNPAATATGLAVWGWILRIVVTVSLAVLTLVVPATSILVDQGPRVQAIVDEHRQALGVLGAVDPATQEALTANPNDVGALARALGEVARQQGAGAAEAQAVSKAVTTRAPQLAAVQAIPPATRQALLQNPTDPAADAAAVRAIMQRLGVGQRQAIALLTSLGSPDVRSDLALIQKYVTVLTSARAEVPVGDLAHLRAHLGEVQQAKADAPHQWQTWWWVCVAGQVLFVPFVFVMSGRWSPRRAREDEREHEALVARELAALQAARTR